MPWKAQTHGERVKGRREREPNLRATASRRGYNATWRRLRRMVLRREPLCRECKSAGFDVPAVLVDHITPLSEGGTNKLENLQSLCTMHHNQKTARERNEK